jgi:hypothetical protein
MNNNNEHLTHARALRADILGAPEVWLPRRAVLLDWLDDFLTRASGTKFQLDQTEATDLDALDHFLRKKKIPVAG